MENEQALQSAVNVVRSSIATDTKQVIEANDISRWLPYLDMDNPHHLDPDRADKLKCVEEVMSYFKEISPDDPFSGFLKHVTSISLYGDWNQSKISQVLRSIRLLKLAKTTKMELERLGIQ